MNRLRRTALVGVVSALACAATAGASGGPRIVSAAPGAPAELDRALELVVTAVPRGDRVQGVRVSFPDLQGIFAESACRIGPARAAAAASPADAFAVPYRPAWTGLHLLELAVTAGGCGSPAATSRRSLPIEVAAATAPAAAGVPGRGCAGADLLPLRPRLRRLRLAVVCLINRERRAQGLVPLRTSRPLRRVASHQVRDMRRHAYFGHARPGGAVLRARLRGEGAAASVAGENLGTAPARLGTPRSIVGAWLASDSLRRNLLDPAFRSVGVAVVAVVPGVIPRSGGTYAVELGR